jgi:hypothetical protein
MTAFNLGFTRFLDCPSCGIFLALTDPTEISPNPSPEDGNRSSFKNAVFFRIPDK